MVTVNNSNDNVGDPNEADDPDDVIWIGGVKHPRPEKAFALQRLLMDSAACNSCRKEGQNCFYHQTEAEDGANDETKPQHVPLSRIFMMQWAQNIVQC